MISTNQFKNGNHIEVEGTIFKLLEFQHVKPGKGGAFVRTKLRRAADGAVIDRTFRAGEKFRPVRTEARKFQFLYADGTDAHFMDSESFEQIASFTATLFTGRGGLSFAAGLPSLSALLGILLLAVIELVQYNWGSDRQFYRRLPGAVVGLTLALMIYLTFMGTSNEPAQFIYFQF